MTRRAALAVVVMLAAGGLRADLRGAIPGPAIATPIEQALIEQACSAPPAIAIDPDRHDECLHAKLTSLRADFGRDLNKLSSGDRRRIDAACEQIRGAEGREGYLSCLASQLTALQARWNRGRGAAAETTQVAAASPDPQLVSDMGRRTHARDLERGGPRSVFRDESTAADTECVSGLRDWRGRRRRFVRIVPSRSR
jgi:hypothetical protein